MQIGQTICKAFASNFVLFLSYLFPGIEQTRGFHRFRPEYFCKIPVYCTLDVYSCATLESLSSHDNLAPCEDNQEFDYVFGLESKQLKILANKMGLLDVKQGGLKIKLVLKESVDNFTMDVKYEIQLYASLSNTVKSPIVATLNY